MNLDRLTITIRARNPWEAIDLGCMVARQWFFQLWWLWLVTGFGTGLFLLLVPGLPGQLRLLIFWWLKPLFEPLLLFWLSRALFGETLPLKTVAGQWRSLILPELFKNLFWRRLSPERSFLMPVQILEGAVAETRNQRVRIISKKQYAAPWLSAVCFVVEIVLALSMFALLSLLVLPEFRTSGTGALLFHSTRLPIALYMIAVSLTTPLYVTAGFMLYLSRRVELEAWDIEIGFKKIARRIADQKTASSKRVSQALLIPLLLSAFLLSVEPVKAETRPLPQECRQQIAKVLANKDFGSKRTVYQWKHIKKPEKEATGIAAWLQDFFKNLSKGMGNVLDAVTHFFRTWTTSAARIFEVLLWLIIGGGGAWLLYRYTRISQWFSNAGASDNRQRKPADVLFGLTINPESLPDDIAAECWNLYHGGQLRQALALLYQGTLSRLLHFHELPVQASATELECSLLVKKFRPTAEAGFFNQLTMVWLRTAYGHHPPASQQVADLIGKWSQIYDRFAQPSEQQG